MVHDVIETRIIYCKKKWKKETWFLCSCICVGLCVSKVSVEWCVPLKCVLDCVCVCVLELVFSSGVSIFRAREERGFSRYIHKERNVIFWLHTLPSSRGKMSRLHLVILSLPIRIRYVRMIPRSSGIVSTTSPTGHFSRLR